MRKDYFEMNLKKLIQKSRRAAYRPEFKEELFRQMTREIKRDANPAPQWRADIFRNVFRPIRLRLALEALAVPMILIFAGISFIMDGGTHLSVEDAKVIVSQSADSRNYIMGNGQNVINYFTHASSSHGNFQTLPSIRSGDLRRNSLQPPATNNS